MRHQQSYIACQFSHAESPCLMGLSKEFMHNRMKLLMPPLLGCFLFLTGCATLIRGTSETFGVDSVPQGASVQLSTGQSGVTPFRTKVPRRQTLLVTVCKPGYLTQQISVPTQTSSSGAVAAAANFFTFRDLGGLINAAVDANNGATMEHNPNPLVVNLQKQ